MLGSAVITSVGVGFYKDLSSAAENMIDSNKTVVEPDVEKTKNYQRLYKLYKEIWEKIYKN